MLTALDIARYFLSLSAVDKEVGELMSNLKLQKLVYYAQGYSLAFYDEPLFDDKIEAWQHGPVVPDLYHKYKKHGDGHILPSKSFNSELYSEQVQKHLRLIYMEFGQFSAWRLRNMTHEEPPWLNAINGNREITQKSMKNYFKTQIIEE
jgi:uncharacterized phage-associated protein